MTRDDWKKLFLILRDFLKGKKLFTVCMVLDGLLAGLTPYISVVLVGNLVDGVYRGDTKDALVRYALTGLGILAVLELLRSYTNYIFNQKLEYMSETQDRELDKKGMSLDYEYLENPETHQKRQKAGMGSDIWFGLLGGALSNLSIMLEGVTSCVLAIVVVVPMFFVKKSGEYGFVGSVWMSILFFALMIFLIWGSYRRQLYYLDRNREVRFQNAPYETRRKWYLNLLAKAETQKDRIMYGQQGIIEDEMDKIVDFEKNSYKKSTAFEVRLGLATDSITSLMAILIYLFAGMRGYIGMITIGSVVTYAASISRVSYAVYRFTSRYGFMRNIVEYVRSYYEFMNLSKNMYEGTIPVEKRRDNKFSVDFEHVSFRYPGAEDYVIRDLNLSFVIGERMAIVGKNGSGKTTFIKLLCRLYDVTEGCIKVNGIDIRKYDHTEYNRLFGAVFQDFRIFDFPVGENLSCSVDVEEERAYDALRRAGLYERIASDKDGLNTYVGKGFDESGVNFSGGEKQKLAIARAIYKNAPFVIMDEPTAALDPESEAEVFAGFDNMVGGKTAIYISHRLASCKFCEDILVFDKGQVVQHGSHEKLVREDGMYKRLWDAQAQYYQL